MVDVLNSLALAIFSFLLLVQLLVFVVSPEEYPHGQILSDYKQVQILITEYKKQQHNQKTFLVLN